MVERLPEIPIVSCSVTPLDPNRGSFQVRVDGFLALRCHLRRLPGKTDELKAKNLDLILQSTRQSKGDSSLYSIV